MHQHITSNLKLPKNVEVVFRIAQGRESWPTPLRREKAAEAARSPPRREAQTLNV